MDSNRLFAFLIFMIPTFLYAQTSDSLSIHVGWKDGVSFTVGEDFQVKFGVRSQTQFNMEQSMDDVAPETVANTEIRRLRFKMGGFIYDPKLTYYFQYGFDWGLPRLHFALVRYQFSSKITFVMGQNTVPASRQFMISSGKLMSIDRNLLDRRFFLFIDRGLFLQGKFNLGQPHFMWWISFFGGEGPDTRPDNRGYGYNARLDIQPFGAFKKNGAYVEGDLFFEETPKLAIGSSFNFNDNAVRIEGERGSFITDNSVDFTTIFVDWMFKYRGFSILGQYAYRDSKIRIAPKTQGSELPVEQGNGFANQIGYTWKAAHSIYSKFEFIHEERVMSSGYFDQYEMLAGYTHYLKGHNLKLGFESGLRINEFETLVDRIVFVRTQLHFEF